MRATRLALVLALSVPLVLSAACGGKKKEEAKTKEQDREKVTLGEVRQQVGEAVEKIQDFTFQEKEGYQKKFEARLAEYDRKLEELKGRASQATGEAKKKLDRKVRKLEKRQKNMRRMLEKLGTAGAEAWQDIIEGLNRAVADMEQAIGRTGRRRAKAQP